MAGRALYAGRGEQLRLIPALQRLRRRPSIGRTAAGRVSSAVRGQAASQGAAMTIQRRTSALAFITGLDASRVSRVMATVRLGIGAVGMLAPGRLAWRLFVHGERVHEATVLALRATAGRDLALGLGTALASKRGPVSLRGWPPLRSLTAAMRSPSQGTSRQAPPCVRRPRWFPACPPARSCSSPGGSGVDRGSQRARLCQQGVTRPRRLTRRSSAMSPGLSSVLPWRRQAAEALRWVTTEMTPGAVPGSS